MELKHPTLLSWKSNIVVFWFRLLCDSINIYEILQLFVHSRVLCWAHVGSSSLYALILNTCWHVRGFIRMTGSTIHHCLSCIRETIAHIIPLLSEIGLWVVSTFLVLVVNVGWLSLTWRQILVMLIGVFNIISYNVLFLSCHFVTIYLFSWLN